MKIIYVIVLLLGVVAFATAKPAFCPAIWSPVCGTDGVTYASDCMLEAADVPLWYNGECQTINLVTCTII